MSLSELMIDIPAEHEANVFGQFDAYAKKLERTFHVTFSVLSGFTRSGSYRIRILPASRQPKTVRIYGDQAGSGRKDVFEQTVHCQTIPRQTFSRIFV